MKSRREKSDAKSGGAAETPKEKTRTKGAVKTVAGAPSAAKKITPKEGRRDPSVDKGRPLEGGNVKSGSNVALSQTSQPTRVRTEKARSKTDPKVNISASKADKSKGVPAKAFASVTVNSPVAKRRAPDATEREGGAACEGDADRAARERTKTRTLDPDESKVFSSPESDGSANSERLRILAATMATRALPKAFFVPLGDQPESSRSPAKDDDSYEDDFESYEDDFDSSSASSVSKDVAAGSGSPRAASASSSDSSPSPLEDAAPRAAVERKLDSGNYESGTAVAPQPVRAGRQSSANSLTDEGFVDMQSVHQKNYNKNVPDVESLLLGRRLRQRTRQLMRRKRRSDDLRLLIALDERHFSCFQMLALPYDQFIARYGGSGTSQASTQTYDDGVDQDSQTDALGVRNAWTQCPVKYSAEELYLVEPAGEGHSERCEDYFESFNLRSSGSRNQTLEQGDSLKTNALRIYLEQKSGAGPCSMMSHAVYHGLVSQPKYDPRKLAKFLERTTPMMLSELGDCLDSYGTTADLQTTTLKCSEGSVNLLDVDKREDVLKLKDRQVSRIFQASDDDGTIITVHAPVAGHRGADGACIVEDLVSGCVACLWNVRPRGLRYPVEVLAAQESILCSTIRSRRHGLAVAALRDGSICLWDLSERREWHYEVPGSDKENGDNLIIRRCSYTTCCDSIADKGDQVAIHGDVVAMVISQDSVTRRRSDFGYATQSESYGQVFVLYERAFMQVWGLRPRTANEARKGSAPWSAVCLSLVRSVGLEAAPRRAGSPSAGSHCADDFDLTAATARTSRTERGHCGGRETDADSADDAAGLLCFDMMRASETGDVFASCSGGIVVRVRARSRKQIVYRIADSESDVTSLSPCSRGDQQILVAGDNHGRLSLIHTQRRNPLLQVTCRLGSSVQRGPQQQDKITTDLKGRFLNSVSNQDKRGIWCDSAERAPAEGGGPAEILGCGVLRLARCAQLPCVWLALCGHRPSGALLLFHWDLIQSDLAPTDAQVLGPLGSEGGDMFVVNGTTLVILCAGQVQVHRLKSTRQGGMALAQEEDIFRAYVALL